MYYCFRFLLLAGASPSDLIPKFAEIGNLEMIQLCTEFGANLNAQDENVFEFLCTNDFTSFQKTFSYFRLGFQIGAKFGT